MEHKDDNKAIVRQFNDCLSRGDDSCMRDLMSPDYVLHTFQDTYRGKDGFNEMMREVRTAFPDIRMHVEDQVAEDDRVVNRFTMTGTHDGEFQGIPPTHKRVRTTGMGMFYLKDGKIVEQWSEVNIMGLMSQIGAGPK